MVIEKVIYPTAIAAGLSENDRIIGIDGVSPLFASQVSRKLYDNRGNTVSVEVIRDGQTMTMDVRVDTAGYIGIRHRFPIHLFETVTVKFNFFNSFPAGIRLGVNTLKGYVSDMKYVFTKEGAKNIGGFGTIGSLFPASWNWSIFWERTAFLSIILAFMNILPIPALDGGHVLFLLYEVITRRKPGDKFLEYAQIAGMILIITLVLFANGNDILRFFFK
jgi:regulator of sigma E protease